MTDPQELLVVYGGRPGEGLVFAPDGSGWAAYTTGDRDPTALVYVRVGRIPPSARLVIRGILIETPRGNIDARALRSIAVGRLESAVNQPTEYPRIVEQVAALEEQAAPFPSDLVTTEGWPWWMYQPTKPRSPRLKMKVPISHRKPDRFYEQVAERFGYLSMVSERPAAELAEANGVPTTRVHGWVREARRRGLLPSGERAAKVGGSA